MINYEIFKEQKLIIVKYQGNMTEPLLISFIVFIFDKIKNEPVNLLLNDFRESFFDFDLKQLRNIIKVRIEKASEENYLKAVHLIENVQQTTYSVLYNEMLQTKYVDINICSTIEYAINLLGLELSVNELENKINSLKNKFNSM